MGQQSNPYNFLKGDVTKAHFISGKFMVKLLRVLSSDRVYFDRSTKDTPGMDGRMIDASGGKGGGLPVPFTVAYGATKATITFNGGTITYDVSAALKEEIWRPGGGDMDIACPKNGYVWIEYGHSSKSFAFRAGARKPDKREFDSEDRFLRANVILAKIKDGVAIQLTFFSFYLSPCYRTDKFAMDFAAYPSDPE